MTAAAKEKIIVVKKKSRRHRGHESHGAWKVAFADFAVAMMAFFLVLWLQEAATKEQHAAISGYFEDPVEFENNIESFRINLGADNASDSETAINVLVEPQEENLKEDVKATINAELYEQLKKKVEQDKFNEIAAEIQRKLENDDALKPYKDQVIFNVTDDGLQIQLVDKEFRPMFDTGSDKIMSHAQGILSELARSLTDLPNKMVISGHTDGLGYANREGYSNWELSAERANAARRTLQKAGIPNRQIAQVVGHGSSDLFKPKDPLNPVNRRVSILVLSEDNQDKMNNSATQSKTGIERHNTENKKENTKEKKSPLQQPSSKPQTQNTKAKAKTDDTVSVQSFRRQQLLRSQKEDINSSNRSVISAPISRESTPRTDRSQAGNKQSDRAKTFQEQMRKLQLQEQQLQEQQQRQRSQANRRTSNETSRQAQTIELERQPKTAAPNSRSQTTQPASTPNTQNSGQATPAETPWWEN